MINELIEKYKQLVEENYDEDNCFADLSKAIVYQEIIQDLEELKPTTINGYSIEEVINNRRYRANQMLRECHIMKWKRTMTAKPQTKDFYEMINEL